MLERHQKCHHHGPAAESPRRCLSFRKRKGASVVRRMCVLYRAFHACASPRSRTSLHSQRHAGRKGPRLAERTIRKNLTKTKTPVSDARRRLAIILSNLTLCVPARSAGAELSWESAAGKAPCWSKPSRPVSWMNWSNRRFLHCQHPFYTHTRKESMVCSTGEGAHSVTRLLLNQHVLQTKAMMVHDILACQLPCMSAMHIHHS